MDDLADLQRLAAEQLQAGQLERAEQTFRTVLAREPARFDVRRELAWLLWHGNRRSEALTELRRTLADAPRLAALHNDLGMMLRGIGEVEASQGSFLAAIDLDPALWQARFNLGNGLLQQGQFEPAVAQYSEALRYAPDDADVYLNRGVALRKLGQLDAARSDLQHSLRLRPSDTAWLNLGMLEIVADDVPQAVSCFERASQLNPGNAQPHFQRGVALRSWNNAAQAIAAFRDALCVDPAHAASLRQMAEVCASAGYTAEAIEAFQRAHRLTADDALRVRAALTMPIIIESEQQIIDVRERLQAELDALDHETLAIENPLAVGTPHFPLAYHGHDERAWQTRIAAILRRAAPQLAYVAPHCIAPEISRDGQRIKLGFVSRNLGDHTIGKLNAGLIERMDREKFEVVVFGADRSHEVLGRRIATGADRHVILHSDLPAARTQIADERLDALFYTDVGLEPMSYFLAHARLAPVQCVTWGHPLTTGIPTLDYFISSDDLEPPGSESQYSEQLVRLPCLAVHYFSPPRSTSTRTRADFGLDPQARVYACLQSPFKLHPDDDRLWAEILRRDPQARLLLLEGQFPEWGQQLRARFSRSMSDVAGRIQFVEQQPPREFARLLELVDVLLDPVHFCGGETSYQSFAVGTPVVTQPGGFLRNRITYALYRAMGISDGIAESGEDYIARALRLAGDREYREQVRSKIFAAHGAIFENDAGVRALEAFLIRVVSAPDATRREPR